MQNGQLKFLLYLYKNCYTLVPKISNLSLIILDVLCTIFLPYLCPLLARFQIFAYIFRVENSVDPDQLASQKPADLDLYWFLKRLFCLFCCFMSQVNSYGHGGTVSSPNHTFSWASLNKQLTSILSTHFCL